MRTEQSSLRRDYEYSHGHDAAENWRKQAIAISFRHIVVVHSPDPLMNLWAAG